MPNYWDSINQLVDEADLVIEVLDARMPIYSRNSVVEKLLERRGKKLIFVLNKSDLVSKKSLEGAKKWLMQFGDCVYVSSKEGTTPKKLLGLIFSHLGKLERDRRRRWKIGFVGYPNTGKSSLINLLVRKQKAKVSSKAGTTHGIQWVRFGESIKILDSPGVIPLRKGDKIRYGLLGVKSPERLKDVEVVAYTIIEIFMKRNKFGFEKFFKIKISDDDSLDDIFMKIAKSTGSLKKGGVPNDNLTSLRILRAWHKGDIRLE